MTKSWRFHEQMVTNAAISWVARRAACWSGTQVRHGLVTRCRQHPAPHAALTAFGLGSSTVLHTPHLPKGFFSLIAAQFTTGWADNALLIVAMAYLQEHSLPAWWAPLLKLSFTLSYVALGPWVGHWADRVPKARLLWSMSGVKALGVLALMGGVNPIAAFALVGLGAAVYAPAKYGWVTENVAAQQLVRANGWLEVSLVLAILLGVAGGGALVALVPHWADLNGRAWAWPGSPLQAAWLVLLAAYALAAVFGAGVPLGRMCAAPRRLTLLALGQDFWRANVRLWRDPLGGISLAATSLFWACGATMQLAVLQWAQARLGMPLSQAAYLQATVAIGVVVGAAWAAHRVRLRQARRGLPLGMALGLVLMAASALSDWRWALIVMLGVGAMSGYLIVPMNALLQYRGHRLLSAGRSIAIQGFNENAAILIAMGAYALSLQLTPNVVWAMVGLGATLAVGSGALWRQGLSTRPARPHAIARARRTA